MVNFLQIFPRDERLCSHGCIGAAGTDKDAAGPMRGAPGPILLGFRHFWASVTPPGDQALYAAETSRSGLLRLECITGWLTGPLASRQRVPEGSMQPGDASLRRHMHRIVGAPLPAASSSRCLG